MSDTGKKVNSDQSEGALVTEFLFRKMEVIYWNFSDFLLQK